MTASEGPAEATPAHQSALAPNANPPSVPSPNHDRVASPLSQLHAPGESQAGPSVRGGAAGGEVEGEAGPAADDGAMDVSTEAIVLIGGTMGMGEEEPSG